MNLKKARFYPSCLVKGLQFKWGEAATQWILLSILEEVWVLASQQCQSDGQDCFDSRAYKEWGSLGREMDFCPKRFLYMTLTDRTHVCWKCEHKKEIGIWICAFVMKMSQNMNQMWKVPKGKSYISKLWQIWKIEGRWGLDGEITYCWANLTQPRGGPWGIPLLLIVRKKKI